MNYSMRVAVKLKMDADSETDAMTVLNKYTLMFTSIGI